MHDYRSVPDCIVHDWANPPWLIRMDAHVHARLRVAFFVATKFLAAILSAPAMSFPLPVIAAARTWKDAANSGEQGDKAD